MLSTLRATGVRKKVFGVPPTSPTVVCNFTDDVFVQRRNVWFYMKNITICLVIRFLLLLKPTKVRLFDAIKRDHGNTSLKSVLGHVALSKKYEKCSLDLNFLLSCKTYDIFPKFLRFKLYKKSLHTTSLYKSWQSKLLDGEIKLKRKRQTELEKKRNESCKAIRSLLSFFQVLLVRHCQSRYFSWIQEETWVYPRKKTTTSRHR